MDVGAVGDGGVVVGAGGVEHADSAITMPDATAAVRRLMASGGAGGPGRR